MKILFIDHSFHQKTRSSRFFADRLLEAHQLEWLFIDPLDIDASYKLDMARRFDLAILWQMDYLAPLLLARGVPTVVIPMYDGSSLMPDLHWVWMKDARVVNFCRRLHDHVETLGCTSRLAKYYLPPVPPDRRARFDNGLHVMLWQRRPEHGLNLHTVEALFGNQLKSVHVHDAPDDPAIDSTPYLKQTLDGYRLTVSKWFESRDDYEAILDQCNVLVAPRRAEGIGMTMLEGLARGMLVVGADAPTHDEYISNWISGVLFNPDSVGFASFDHAERIGEMAWRSAVDGSAAWEAGILDLVDFVASTPRPKLYAELDVASFGKSLARAYRAGVDTYRGFLMANTHVIADMTGTCLVGKIDATGTYRPQSVQRTGRFSTTRELPWLEQHRADASLLVDGSLIVEGSLRLHDDVAWMLGHSLVLGFRIDPQLGVTRRLRILFLHPPNAETSLGFAVSLNGATLTIDSLPVGATAIELQVPAHAVQHDNLLHLMVGATSFGYGWAEPIGLGFERIEFVE